MPKGAMVTHTYSYLAGYSFALTLTRNLQIESRPAAGGVPAADLPHRRPDLQLPGLPLRRHADHGPRAGPREDRRGDHARARDLALGRVAGDADRARRGPRPRAAVVRRAQPHDGDLRLDGGAPRARSPRSSVTAASSLVTCEILGQTEAIACHRFWPDKWRETFLRTAPDLNYVGVPEPDARRRRRRRERCNSLRDQPGVIGEVVYRSPVVTAGLLQGRGRHARGVPRRLVPLRRPLHVRRGRPAHHGRPLEGHREVRRRERLDACASRRSCSSTRRCRSPPSSGCRTSTGARRSPRS